MRLAPFAGNTTMDHAAQRNARLSEGGLVTTDGGILVVEPTLQGRSGGMRNVKREQMFCQLDASVADLSQVNDFVDTQVGWADSTNRANGGVIAGNCDRLWLVSVRGTEVYRTSADGMNPLSSSIIQNGPLPAGASRSDNIHAYRVRVKVTTPSEFAVYEIDCNQEMEFWGQGIDVSLMGPANAISIASNADLSSLTRNNFVADSLVACGLYPIEQSRGCCECYLTEFLRSPANTASVIRVPRGARAVKIYQGVPPAAAATLRWIRFVGDPNVVAAINVGGIDFVNRQSDEASAPIGEESHLQTDIEPANPRLFVLRWTIRP